LPAALSIWRSILPVKSFDLLKTRLSKSGSKTKIASATRPKTLPKKPLANHTWNADEDQNEDYQELAGAFWFRRTRIHLPDLRSALGIEALAHLAFYAALKRRSFTVSRSR
jgi:hypothetical protein